MDKKKAIDFIQELLRSNVDKKPENQLSRKEIVDILTVDHLIPESTAYRYYADAERIYIWEQEKSGNPVAVDKQKVALDAVWDIAQNALHVKKDPELYMRTIKEWSVLSTRFRKG